MRLSVTLGEAARTAAAQRVSSVMVAVLCAAICAVTLLTVGRTAAAEAQVLSRLDTAGSRLLVVTDERDAGLVTPAVIEVLAGLDTIERVVGVDAPFDLVNAVIGDGGTRVPAWRVTGELAQVATLSVGRWPQPGEALVSSQAQRALGMVHPAGVVTDGAGRQHDVVGGFTALAPFDSFDAGIIIAGDGHAAARSVQVVVATVEAARVTERLTLTTLAPPDLSEISVQSPAALADLQRAVGGDLGDYGRGILLLTLGGGAFLITVVVLGEVLLRRRDLGRRRALGAPRWGLVTLVVARTVTAAIPGAAIGTVAGLAAAAALADRPPADFTAATAILTILVAALASIAPAIIAAGRDPVGVLRTP
jgi:putative ABC transport system permease protein